MDDEHMIAGVYAYSNGRPKYPVVRQGFGPEGIDLEGGSLRSRLDGGLDGSLGDEE
jgi:hypothetical protein